MKNLTQYLNEALIMELSSELLGRASKAAREKKVEMSKQTDLL